MRTPLAGGRRRKRSLRGVGEVTTLAPGVFVLTHLGLDWLVGGGGMEPHTVFMVSLTSATVAGYDAGGIVPSKGGGRYA